MKPPHLVARFDVLSYPFEQYPVAFIDYLWVIIVYVVTAFALAALIDGYMLPPFDAEKASLDSSPYLAAKVIIQLALQGFIAIFLCAMLRKLPSPVNGIFDYDHASSLGAMIRGPAIISVLLFALSNTLQGNLFILYSRFDANEKKDLVTELSKMNNR